MGQDQAARRCRACACVVSQAAALYLVMIWCGGELIEIPWIGRVVAGVSGDLDSSRARFSRRSRRDTEKESLD